MYLQFRIEKQEYKDSEKFALSHRACEYQHWNMTLDGMALDALSGPSQHITFPRLSVYDHL